MYNSRMQRLHTVHIVHTLNLVHERATRPFQKIKITFIPFGRRCELGSWKTRKTVEKQTSKHSPRQVNDPCPKDCEKLPKDLHFDSKCRKRFS